MKELLTLKEAASLAGRTTKTIKNYIKQGKISNFFLVEGKYGQEYRISLKDIEPLMKEAGKSPGRRDGTTPGKDADTRDVYGFSGDSISPEDIYDRPEYQFLLRRNDEILMELGRCREKAETLESSNLQLRQEAEEKDMLISMLMKKEPSV
jgi:hypothetical protein